MTFRGRGRALAVMVAAALLYPTIARADPGSAGGAGEFELDSRKAPDPDNGPTHYVTLTDGTSIALNVSVPEGCDATNPCPAIFEMSGYDGGSDDGDTPAGSVDAHKDAAISAILGDAAEPYESLHDLPMQGGTRAAHGGFHDDEYAVVLASVRGTGCSSGEFDLFSWRSALDGRELIDGWIARQDWSNGDVAIFGHSYSGITGAMVAATRPRHLRTISVSGLIGDLYRDIVYPGGVRNYGFPLLWTGVVRPAYDVGGGVGGGLIGDDLVNVDPICAENQAGKSRTVLNDPLVHGLQDTDSEWYRARSLYSSVSNIEVPVHITTTYQDEQTGPRGAYTVWDHLPEGISKRLVSSSGVHSTQTRPYIGKDRLAWLDYWMLGRDLPAAGEAEVFDEYGVGSGATLADVFGPRDQPTTTTRTFLGLNAEATGEVAQLHSDGFPYSQTDFVEKFVTSGADGSLVLADAPPVAAGSASWLNGSRRQSYNYQAGRDHGAQLSTPTGPDELELFWEFDQDTVLAGPAIASLFVSSSTPETELFVQLIDENPATGEMLYLQRGMLRGGHRAIDQSRSSYFTEAGSGETVMWRPHRPHTASQLVTPGKPVRYDIEIFPVGHIFRAGHRLTVKVHAPPASDDNYVYVPTPTAPAGVNTLHFGADMPSSILLPTIPLTDLATMGDFPAKMCGSYHGMRCVQRQTSLASVRTPADASGHRAITQPLTAPAWGASGSGAAPGEGRGR